MERVKQLNKARTTPVEVSGKKYITVDVDISTMDDSRTKKEGVSRTCKGF